jgi:hypothetical protein
VLAAPVLTITPLKVSAPELPVKLVPPSTPVVSGRIVTLKKVNQISSL